MTFPNKVVSHLVHGLVPEDSVTMTDSYVSHHKKGTNNRIQRVKTLIAVLVADRIIALYYNGREHELLLPKSMTKLTGFPMEMCGKAMVSKAERLLLSVQCSILSCKPALRRSVQNSFRNPGQLLSIGQLSSVMKRGRWGH
jgi:hypothetical protein